MKPDNEQLSSPRPVYHFTALANWLNDPNGLVYIDGRYHLFYQHHPYDNDFGTPHWGHASSEDLLSWSHHPIALEPDELGMIFSGSAVVDEYDTAGFGPRAIVAAFTHHLDAGIERQSLAYSTDRGLSFTKYAGNPVIEQPAGAPDFRDPRLLRWNQDAGHWVMLIAVGTSVHFYTSPDLKRWSLTSVFDPDSGSARVWECPDLFELPLGDSGETRWVLTVGVDKGDLPQLYGTRYWVGDFDGDRFSQSHSAVHWADYGADFYAAQTWSSAPNGRRIWIGWMNNWTYARQTPTSGWRGAMSVPRELGLLATADGMRLTQRPVGEIESRRRHLLSAQDLVVAPDGNPLETVEGTALDIVLVLDVAASDAHALRLAVRVGEDESTDVVLDLDTGALTLDRYRSGRHILHREYAGPRLATVEQSDGCIDLRVLVDATSIEVFAGRGLVVITEQIFPLATSTGCRLEAVGGKVQLSSIGAYAMEPSQGP